MEKVLSMGAVTIVLAWLAPRMLIMLQAFGRKVFRFSLEPLFESRLITFRLENYQKRSYIAA
jgi:hypothetical protein